MATGTYWIYQGTREAGKEKLKKIECRTEVLEHTERGGIVVAVIRGYPVCGERTQALIAVENREFYLVDDVNKVVTRLRDSNDTLVDLVKDEDIVLSFPFERGKRFCEAGQITRVDGFYCWVVEEQRRGKLASISGVFPHVDREVYKIAFRTIPDHIFIEFVAGIGIVSYEYSHHGTTDNEELKLVEFHRGVETSQ